MYASQQYKSNPALGMLPTKIIKAGVPSFMYWNFGLGTHRKEDLPLIGSEMCGSLELIPGGDLHVEGEWAGVLEE